MKKITSFIIVFLIATPLFAQQANHYDISLSSYISSQSTLPFWMVSNTYGMVPNFQNGIFTAHIARDFNTEQPQQLQFAYGAKLSGYTGKQSDVFVNELYGSMRFKKLQLDIGAKHQPILWEGLSSSNGNITMSTNARSFPGYQLQLTEYIKFPFAKKWLSFRGTYGDYLLNDKRIVDNARLHTKSLFLKSKINAKLELVTGIHHYVQWAGTSPEKGKQPSQLRDYLKIITGSSGGNNATDGDRQNGLGNHLGSYLLQLNYKGEKSNWNFYYSHLFEDRSGREMKNWRDGLYGLFVDLKQPRALVTHLLTEFTYTKHASGIGPEEYTDDQGVFHASSAMDNYFNNYLYQSGWTYFGNTIGSPYFTTKPVDENGITPGIIKGDNRFMALNIGAKGYIHKIAYNALLSHTTYFGWFRNEYSPKPTQFSGLIEVFIPKLNKFPFELTLGTSFDTGTYRPVNFGGFLRIAKRGIF